MSEQYVYFFADGHADGHGQMKDVLGGKGAGLAEMTNLGISVPPGFTITTEACNAYFDAGKQLPEGMWDQTLDALQHRSGRQVHALGQLQVADAPVVLQHTQDAAVDLVDVAVAARRVRGVHGAGFSVRPVDFRIRCGPGPRQRPR